MTTALYRRYRPDTFDDVIGQEHVTKPLQAALRAGRITHAYLFSGPRGCGKTTSARIMARCLNCEQGPTDTPCGVCDSCRELATGGPGSLDVVEIDAASHNGVDDARDLRERAAFAPVRDRYKIFILDEAHMVSPQGFNALLKIVEEPPEHVLFIFATTEPDKVIGTIRSRTHHYPFRLVPPDTLRTYLHQICQKEKVEVEGGVLPLVVRAGGGSVRDSLSVLDQLIAGADGQALTYHDAVALLGYTDQVLLDRAVDAMAGHDAPALFALIEQMVESGHDPRRFVEDLLERLRDLLVVEMSGSDVADVLPGIPDDQQERMVTQAHTMGSQALCDAAETTDAALREMTGATSPRLQVELLAARLLLPRTLISPLEDSAHAATSAGASSASGKEHEASEPMKGREYVAAWRRARNEKNAAQATSGQSASAQSTPGQAGESASASSEQGAPARPDAHTQQLGTRTDQALPRTDQAETSSSSGAISFTRSHPEASPDHGHDNRTKAAPDTGVDTDASATPAPPDGTRGGDHASSSAMIRDRWDEIMGALSRISKATWARVSNTAQVGPVDDKQLMLIFQGPGPARQFNQGGHAAKVARALYEVVGLQREVIGSYGDGPHGGSVPHTPDQPSLHNRRPQPPANARASVPSSQTYAPHHDSSSAEHVDWSSAPARPRTATSSPASGDAEWGEVAPLGQLISHDRENPDAPVAPVVPLLSAASAPDDDQWIMDEGAVEPPSSEPPAPEYVPDEAPPVSPSALSVPSARVADSRQTTEHTPDDEVNEGDIPSRDDPDATFVQSFGLPVAQQILGASVIEDQRVDDAGHRID